MRSVVPFCLLAGLLTVLTPNPVHAYIGPGAGFAVGGSFLAVFAAFFSAFVLIISWPVRLVWRAMFRRRPPKPPRFKRVVILGLDGLDHGLTEKLLAEGKLPHLAACASRAVSCRSAARCRRSRRSPGRRSRPASIPASTTSSTS